MAPDESFVAASSAQNLLYLYFLDEDLLHVLPFSGDGAYLEHIWISPDSRWIATKDFKTTLRYWPVPRGPSLQDRPIEELLDVLRAQTNYRVVLDPEKPEGYEVTVGDFPGWSTPVNWQEWYSEEYFENPPWRSYRDVLEEADVLDR